MNGQGSDSGMTLIEILIATMITAVILTVLVASFMIFFNNSTYISGRDDHAAGAEVLSSFLDRDLASATSFQTVAGALTACPTGSTAQPFLTLKWTEYASPTPTPQPPDIDPSPIGPAYSATYTLEHDDTALSTSSTCMIKRTYSGGTTTVLMRGLANIGIGKPATPAASCANGQSVVLSLNQYRSTSQADTSQPYTYVGCLKARTNGLP